MTFTGKKLVFEPDLPEKAIENQILNWLRFKEREGDLKIMGYKVKSMGTFDQASGRFRAPSLNFRKGSPDIVCVVRGLYVGLEVKTRTGRLSDVQKQFHADVAKAGGVVFVVRSLEDAQSAIEEIDTKVDQNSLEAK